MPRILQLRSTSEYIAGPERVILALADPLRGTGFELAILALSRRSDYPQGVHPFIGEARKAGIPAEQVLTRNKFSPTAWRRGIQLVRDLNCKIVHANDHKTDLLALLVARATGCAPLATVHGHELDSWRMKAYRQVDLRVLRHFPKVIAISHQVASELARSGIARERILVVHNGIDAKRFRTGADAESQFSDRPGLNSKRGPVIVVVGRLTPDKGQRELIKALPLVRSHIPSIQLLIVGDGPCRSRLEALVRDLDLADDVVFVGNQHPVGPYLEYADVLAVPSRREAMGYVLLEAMALGKAIVATRVGGIPEVLQDGCSARLVAPGAAAELATALVEVLTQPALAQRLGTAARTEVDRRFSAEQMARRVAQVYESLTG